MSLPLHFMRKPPEMLTASVRHFRTQLLGRRCLSSVPNLFTPSTDLPLPLSSEETPPSIFREPRKRKTPHQFVYDQSRHLNGIKIRPSPPSTAKAHRFPIQDWTNTHLATLDPTGARTRLFTHENPNRPQPGDVLLANFNTGEPFSGVCLSIRSRGLDTAILLRNRVLTTGVEMWVKIYSPNVKSIEVVERAKKRARRARLYYMRKPKHDRGSVEGVVEEYLKRRRLIRSGSITAQGPSGRGQGGSTGGKKKR